MELLTPKQVDVLAEAEAARQQFKQVANDYLDHLERQERIYFRWAVTMYVLVILYALEWFNDFHYAKAALKHLAYFFEWVNG